MTFEIVELAGMGLGVLVLGLLVGVLLGRLAGRRERTSLAESLRVATEALEKLRSDTADHFERAGELFTDLTDRYVAYSRHLASGAALLAGARQHQFPSISVAPRVASNGAAPSGDLSCASGAESAARPTTSGSSPSPSNGPA